jgi:hypothetical protein
MGRYLPRGEDEDGRRFRLAARESSKTDSADLQGRSLVIPLLQ